MGSLGLKADDFIAPALQYSAVPCDAGIGARAADL
jgi:hypothetical protein